ncbi:MAG: hypothetical protein E7422_08555 [Ruminococcaceae bacterium]|nr:hypothetical protein [Oscillospiraceae bacterium]
MRDIVTVVENSTDADEAGTSSEVKLLIDAMNELARAKQETAEAKAARSSTAKHTSRPCRATPDI